MSATHHSFQNLLLKEIAPEELAKLSRELVPVDMPKDYVIAAADGPIDHIYFPDCGLGSIVAISPEGNQVEAGMFGRDGFSPVQALIGSDISIHEIVMQTGGYGHRMKRADFMKVMEESPSFAHLLSCYSQVLAIQTTFTALSNATHSIDERLARWLLMCHDRMDGDELLITHDYIAFMLGVRRPSVTTSLHVLEGNGFIRSERRCIVIRNRGALEDFAHDAYGKPEAEYRRLFGKPLHKHSNVIPLVKCD
ncbi:Crp/Fnr family transcriptional regulator [Neorhizobium sp. SOG26]|uniref:Crp/Fnr family transcriptional regulator n=1 Tax=Neorhizobium sp. SOG26 TaxID=2060726 RepID=UPI000E57FA6E|nr:Crp/Fnr family transcriptional regulator [Neorhizobium sp. SOG26]AXV15210.1 Crp/Fnr family transcriptional regulator [Neorhizobium sp. SOG26]